MKKRIYKINNKNLVTGNPNEVTENEILVKENNDGTIELSHRNNGTLETLGSGGSEGGSNVKYYDVSNLEQNQLNTILMLAILCKYSTQDNPSSKIVNLMSFALEQSYIGGTFFAISANLELKIADGNDVFTLKEIAIQQGVYDILMSCPELTEEQFYDLTLPTE